jgi:predicted MFS family arabinose efflux permease
MGRMGWRALARLRARSPRISRNSRLFLWTVFLSNVGVSGIFLLLYNLYLVALGYQEDFIGFLSLVQMGAIAAGAVPAGTLSERYGPRLVLVVGTAVIAAGALGMSLASQPWALALLNVVTGTGFAMRVVPYTPYLVDNTTPAERTLVFSANSAAISIAGTAGSLIGGQLPAFFARLLHLGAAESIPSFRLSLVVGALLGLVAVVPMSMATDRTEPDPEVVAGPPPSPEVATPPAQARRQVAVFIGTTVLFALSGACIGPFINVYFSRVLGLSAATISLISATSATLAAVTTVAASSLADRIGKVRAMVAIRTVGAPLLLLLALNPGTLLATAAVLVRNITDMAAWPLDGAFLAAVIPLRRQARTVAYRSVAWNATWALTAFVAGLAIVRVGYGPMFALAGCVLIAAGVVYYLAFAKLERSRPQH